ncbi:MAG: Gfo/Idh/MocA family oxidoreductase [Synergistaceae bacterium]|nr:Gfo/Idh/MocA family oxidoreductase [Synergistaceae bacterium]
MERLRVGVAGLGRLGKVHARNIAQGMPGAELGAACSIVPEELDWARAELGVTDAYGDFRDMLASARIDAVCIVTTTTEHCWQIEAALDAGKHVFCEKPLGVDVAQCESAEAAARRHPELVCMLGFMRRYDASYARAKEMVERGDIGTPYLVKATGIDPEAAVEGAIRFSPGSGGIFLDMAIHDIDLCRWFLGSEATEVYAMGATFAHPEFREAGDDETGVACYKFASGAMAVVHVGRTAPHGSHVETEIVGTKGTIRISPVPQRDLTVLYGPGGVSVECVGSFPERFAEAYRAEMEEFVACALAGRSASVGPRDGTRATTIAFATTEAWRTGKPVAIPAP